MVAASHLAIAKEVNLAPEFRSMMASNSLITMSWADEERIVERPLSVDVIWENIGDLVTASIL